MPEPESIGGVGEEMTTGQDRDGWSRTREKEGSGRPGTHPPCEAIWTAPGTTSADVVPVPGSDCGIRQKWVRWA